MGSWLVVLPRGVSPWVVVVMFIFVVLAAGVAKAIQRPRTAEDELGEPKLPPISKGNTQTVDTREAVKRVLQMAQSGRATGALQVTAAGRTCSLYFLFGHLFHAASGDLAGEPAVHECLTWQDVRFAWDTKQKLPTEETIERPIDQILAA